ncbi:MAG: hypothetical protein JWP85_727 [Rhodoglobus sp.]|nr:hypothetical protein [Rhodoglobus sp.]
MADIAAQLAIARERLNSLNAIRANATKLEGTAGLSGSGTLTITGSDGTSDINDPKLHEPLTIISVDGSPIDLRAPKKKIRSTQLVADMINESNARWTRQEIHDGFRERIGVPPTWENPANAINNAIARAVEKTLIVEQDGHYMSPSLAVFQTVLDIEGRDDD